MFNSKITDNVKSLKFFKQNFRLLDIDSRELYQKNLNTQPIDWYYRKSQVTYTVNKHKYRTTEFKNIDWTNSIVVFGCSIVFGVGLTDDDTIDKRLSSLLNVPVINMGMPGSSIQLSWFNSIILKNIGNPLAVVQLWTGLERTCYFNKRSVDWYGSWNLQKNNYMDIYNKDPSHGKVHAMMASLTNKKLWNRYYEASFFDDTSKTLNCDKFAMVDYARDLLHPGRETTKLAAEKIAKGLGF